MSTGNVFVRDWPDPALNRANHVNQVMYAQTMAALARGSRRNPAIDKWKWEAIESLAAGVPVNDLAKFDLWLDGTAKFFTLLRNHSDFSAWVEDAFRIARRLGPSYSPPSLVFPLDKHQATVELEAIRAQCQGSLQQEQGEGGTPPADPFADLRQFARAVLRGQERAVIESLCDAGGKLWIVDLAAKDGVGWNEEFEGFKNAQKRLNPKLKRIGWTLARQNNTANVKRIRGLEEGSKRPSLALD